MAFPHPTTICSHFHWTLDIRALAGIGWHCGSPVHGVLGAAFAVGWAGRRLLLACLLGQPTNSALGRPHRPAASDARSHILNDRCRRCAKQPAAMNGLRRQSMGFRGAGHPMMGLWPAPGACAWTWMDRWLGQSGMRRFHFYFSIKRKVIANEVPMNLDGSDAENKKDAIIGG
jgi:hypothetical protein